jgi:hypothetical protein
LPDSFSGRSIFSLLGSRVPPTTSNRKPGSNPHHHCPAFGVSVKDSVFSPTLVEPQASSLWSWPISAVRICQVRLECLHPELPDIGERIALRHLMHRTSGLRDQGHCSGWRHSQGETSMVTKSRRNQKLSLPI